MGKKFNFTKRSLDALPLPSNGISALYYYDTKVQGLAIRVNASGSKTFVWYRSINGRPRRLTIGRYPTHTIEQARRKSAEINAQVVQGRDPVEEKRSLRQEATFAELFKEYIERHAKVYKRSWREDEAQYRRYLLPIANQKISNLKRSDIQRIHSRIGQSHGHYAANRALALVRSVFNRAREWGWEGANPAIGIKRFSEKSRDRFLQPDELERLFKALTQEPNETFRDYVLISLFTGARRTNVLSMRWEDINFDRKIWTIPITKSGEPYTVPLVKSALAILEHRWGTNSNQSPYVFPGIGKKGHLTEPKRGWNRLLRHAQIENLRIHDLRRSLGSYQAAAGTSLQIIGKSLGHKNIATTEIYSRLNLDPVRDSMERAVSAMLDAGNQFPKAEVVKIR